MVQWAQDAGLACAGSSTPAALIVQQALCSRRAALSSIAIVHQHSAPEAPEPLSPGEGKVTLDKLPRVPFWSGSLRAEMGYSCQASFSAQADETCWLEVASMRGSKSLEV